MRHKTCPQDVHNLGNSLVVQWLGLGAFTARARVQSLVRELRYHELHNAAKKRNVPGLLRTGRRL